jgi:IS66 Orf2 like protein
VQAIFFHVEETAAGKRGGKVPGSTSKQAHPEHGWRRRRGNPTAEWAKPDGEAGVRCWACAGIVGGGGVIGLPSLQAMDRAQGARIWMASEATDMRCGFDRLAERVQAVIGENPQSGHLFVFRSRRGDRLKILVWDRDRDL